MKAYSQFLKELPSKKVVFAFGAFQPPTISHELLVKTVDNLATEEKAAKAIYASINEDLKKNPIPPQRKAYYLKRMFPEATIRTAESLIEVAKKLNERYKNAVMVAPSDRVAEYQKLLEKHNGKDYNFDSIIVVSSGQLDPDADTSKIREAAKKGDLEMFKESMPQHFTTMDTKRLMNEMRQGMGLEIIKEQLKLSTDWLRESYFRGELFKLGDIVEADNTVYRIQKLGSNHLLLQNEQGELVSKWIRDVMVSQKPFNHEGLVTEMKFTASDKIKVARIIANSLGVTDVDKTSSAEQLVNTALRKVKNKPMRPEYIAIVHNMLQTAREAGIEYDQKLVPAKVSEETISELSTDLLARYKTKAHASAKASDASGNYAKGDKRFKGINKATFKQFDNDLKKHKQNIPQPNPPGTNAAFKLDTVKEEKPCWSGYKMLGMKKKGKKEVPNCVPEEVQIDEISQKLAGDYYGAATKKHLDKVGMKPNMYGRIEKDMGKQRKAGVDRALDRVTGARKTNEEVDISEDIKKEYDSLKKNHDIKSLRGLIKTQHKIIDTSEFKTKDHAISHYLRTKHGNKKVADAFGLKEDFEIIKEHIEKVKGGYEVESEHSNKNLGKSPTLAGAKKRLKQVEYFKHMKEEETPFDEIDEESYYEEIDAISTLEDIIDAYDDSELLIVDEDTQEEYELSELQEDVIEEGIGRMERMRRKQRWARTKSKREMRTKIALKKTSSMPVLNSRAKRLAINMIKKRMLKKDPSTASVQEKERVEKFIKARPQAVDRLARRMIPRVRQVEKARLRGHKYTQSSTGKV